MKKSGEKCQIASLGQTSRSPPPAKPHPTEKGIAIASPAISAGVPVIIPTIAPAYGPAMRPARNGPASEMSPAS